MLGDVGVGKTRHVQRLLGNTVKSYVPTVCLDMYKIKLHTYHGTMMYELWDVSGDDKYRCIVPSFTQRVDAAMIFVDSSSRDGGRSLDKWMRLVWHKPTIVCGNGDSHRAVWEKRAASWQSLYYAGDSVIEPWMYLTRLLLTWDDVYVAKVSL